MKNHGKKEVFQVAVSIAYVMLVSWGLALCESIVVARIYELGLSELLELFFILVLPALVIGISTYIFLKVTRVDKFFLAFVSFSFSFIAFSLIRVVDLLYQVILRDYTLKEHHRKVCNGTALVLFSIIVFSGVLLGIVFHKQFNTFSKRFSENH